MEKLEFAFQGGARRLPVSEKLVGVAGSGNLEILLEQTDMDGACKVEVATSAHGFATIWQAVLADFHTRWMLADVRVSINDVGATPAVVSLRLDQAVLAAMEGTGV